MRTSPWKSGTPLPRRTHIVWPSMPQLLSQLVIIVLIAGLWAGLLAGYLRLTRAPAPEEETAANQESPQVEAVVVMTPTDSPAQPPTATLTPTVAAATSTPENPVVTSTAVVQVEATISPDPGETPSPQPTETETPTLEPSPLPTDPPTPEPAPTEAPTSPPEDAVAPEGEAAEVSFARDVFPILERRCVKCHGGERPEGGQRIEEGLILKTYADILTGSWNGPVIAPGDPDNSLLIEKIVKGEMPKKEPHLLPGEIRTITAWVEAGALDN